MASDGSIRSLLSSTPSSGSLLTPNDVSRLADEAARQLDAVDIHAAYEQESRLHAMHEREQDRFFLERAKDFTELSEQVETSGVLLKELASFLSTFQKDLSSVSSHISSLQDRSKSIEKRLAARVQLERALSPVLDELVISPQLVDAIFNHPIDHPDFVKHVEQLDAKLTRIRSGPRVQGRKQLDDAAEALRIQAVSRIQSHIVQLIRPYGTSILPISSLHQQLVPVQRLFFFVRRHAARQAHEIQKGYLSTIRWYYETSFRRYVRALEGARLNSAEKVVLLGDPPSVDSLAVLSKKGAPKSALDPYAIATEDTKLDGHPPMTSAALSRSSKSAPGSSPASLFRSAMLLLMHNANREADFVQHFFSRSSGTGTGSRNADSSSIHSPRDGSVIIVDDGVSESGKTSLTMNDSLREEREERAASDMLKRLFHELFDPALEYTQNFVNALVGSPLQPTTLLTMIRLTDSLLPASTSELSPFVLRVRMVLWPVLTKSLDANVDSIKGLSSSSSSSGPSSSNTSGTTKTTVKDSHVVTCVQRYASLVRSFVRLSPDESQTEEMLSSSMNRIRAELDKLLVHQANKMPSDKRSAFLKAQYDEIIRTLRSSSSSSGGTGEHAMAVREISHYRSLSARLK